MNHVVGLDLVEIRNVSQEPNFWLNIVCWGTSYQPVGKVRGDGKKTPENVWNTFVHQWVRIFGIPEIVVVDPGTEFQGYFAEMMSTHGATLLPTDARSPWQNGRTERAGKEWKRQLRLARRNDEPVSDSELETVGELC